MPIDPSKPFDLTYAVTPNYHENRLDQFVKAMIPSMSRTKIQRNIKEGRICVNGEPRASNWRVRSGDEVIIHCKEPEGGAVEAAKKIPLDIIYEDEVLVAINKQADLVVHPTGLYRHNTLLNALYWHYKDLIPEDQEISLANRLDQHTSGVILVAKTTESKRFLQQQFENRETAKIYNALCEGIVAEDTGEINLPIGPGEGASRTSMVIRHDEEGKPSQTVFKVLERFAPQDGDKGFTLVRLEPHTGRQHQLRVHMQSLGHPMVCDDRYGIPLPLLSQKNESEPPCIIARYALHACQLTFMHPDGEMMTLAAPLASDMSSTIECLRAGKQRWRKRIE